MQPLRRSTAPFSGDPQAFEQEGHLRPRFSAPMPADTASPDAALSNREPTLPEEVARIEELVPYVLERIGIETLCLPGHGQDAGVRFEVTVPGAHTRFVIRNLTARLGGKLMSWTVDECTCQKSGCLLFVLHPPKDWPRLLLSNQTGTSSINRNLV